MQRIVLPLLFALLTPSFAFTPTIGLRKSSLLPSASLHRHRTPFARLRASRPGLRMQEVQDGDSPREILEWSKKREEKMAKAPDVSSLPYGEWDSPITSKDITDGTIGLGSPTFDGEDLYWLESRPNEGGRQVIVKMEGGEPVDLTPPSFNVRSRVHEYGGGDFIVHKGIIYFVNFVDQRIYAQLAFPGIDPVPLTPEGKLRFSDMTVDEARGRLICVVEDHSGEGEPRNYIAAVKTETEEGSAVAKPEVLLEGDDFYASPRLSQDGDQLAWVSWRHPNMPWDATVVSKGTLDQSGKVVNVKKVAGGENESTMNPTWDVFGQLFFLSDRSGWYNIYREDEGQVVPVKEMQAEFAGPMWKLGSKPFTFLPDGRILCNVKEPKVAGSRLAALDPSNGQVENLASSYSHVGGFAVSQEKIAFLGGSARQPTELVFAPIAKFPAKKSELTVAKKSSKLEIKSLYLSEPRSIEFPTGRPGQTAWMIFYPPQNAKYVGPPGSLPPLLVKSHGGPTAATSTAFNLGIQFWTSRGYAVADVDYSGSSGYGRDYRERLKGKWGIYDVEDCCSAAKYLEQEGLVDGSKMAIDGGSAGGYTTLCCLTFKDTFKAGCSSYGIGDLETLASDTHKFESRYLDSLVGPYPEMKEEYRNRSPINFVEQLKCPIAFFQGADDRVVPLNQAEAMHKAVKEKGILTSLTVFQSEGHGFRRADNIRTALDGELFFFNAAFGLKATMPGDLEEIVMDNFDPFLPNELRGYVIIDGYELECGLESGVVRQIGYEEPDGSAYFPEERGDQQGGMIFKEKKSEKIDDMVEWL
uniref:Peptidase S9 prolyl oligopeptidase catalytic domain-containing protein n=1 Tax=Hanusia phi TaxID=3032 RepID=A0A7S0EI64_9CRYP|mmetsp:Transcript_25040/g.56520  ORF Transcript_25040/g.56520 Transcript_25040/m.56520 type:complete len:809 (+) Transcript_25040:199-2625(+)